MKLKKLLALGMAIMLLAALTACGGGDQPSTQGGDGELTPYQLVEQASNKLNDADGAAYDMTMDMTIAVPDMSAEQGTITMKLTGDVKQQKVDENNYKLAYNMSTDMSALGAGVIDMEMYYADGYIYYNIPAAATKYKMAMTMEEAMQEANTSALDGIEEEMVKESSVADEGDGKVVTMTLDGTKMTDLVMDMAGDLTASLGDGGEMNIGDIPYTVHIDADGNMTSIEMDMTFDMTVQGTAMNMSMNMVMDVTAVGGVTVELPADLADYPEATEDKLQ